MNKYQALMTTILSSTLLYGCQPDQQPRMDTSAADLRKAIDSLNNTITEQITSKPVKECKGPTIQSK